jgi:hypothetical protein
MRLHFLVRLGFFRVVCVCHAQPYKIQVRVDFARYRDLLFDLKHAGGTQYEEQQVQHFCYRTDYPELMEPKQVIFEVWIAMEKKGICSALQKMGTAIFSLHTLATGPPEYHLPIDIDSTDPFLRQATCLVSFRCQMNQECILRCKMLSVMCDVSTPALPKEIRQHPNSFWFLPDVLLDVWYLTQERMTLVNKTETRLSPQHLPQIETHTDHEERQLNLRSSQPFHIRDTTDMLDTAHLVLQLNYNDRPWKYALVSLPFLDFALHKKQYLFQSRLHSYAPHPDSVPLSIHVLLEITQGPSFWPMQGVCTGSYVSGLCKTNFPRPNLSFVAKSAPVSSLSSLSLPLDRDVVDKLSSIAPLVLSELQRPKTENVPEKKEQETAHKLHLHHALETLLECYATLGYEKLHLQERVEDVWTRLLLS